MSFEKLIDQICGSWVGDYHLWLDPNNSPSISLSKMIIQSKIQDKMLYCEYTWEDEGKAQDGIMIVSFNEKQEEVIMSWVDSWHQHPEFMICRGMLSKDNQINVKGSYKAPKGPNWEWRTKIIPINSDNFTFEMYNITPLGEEALAVQVKYSKVNESP